MSGMSICSDSRDAFISRNKLLFVILIGTKLLFTICVLNSSVKEEPKRS